MTEPNPDTMDENLDVEPEVQPEVPLEPLRLEILQTVKTSQSQNGLRHNDYERYRRYCARRLKRVRKTLKFTTGKTFKHMVLQPKDIRTALHLTIPLINAERAWGYAMQLKAEMNDEGVDASTRKKFHLIKRLTKAAELTAHLETLCTKTADPRTQLEAEAYSAWMHGTVLLEKDDHKGALAKFMHAKKVYEQLGKASGVSNELLCAEKVASLAPSIRYCSYSLQRSGNTEDVDAMLEQAADDDLLRSKLEQVLTDSRREAAKTLLSVEWQDKQVPIQNQKVRMCFIAANQTAETLSSFHDDPASGESKKMDAFQSIFSNFDDAARLIRNDLADLDDAKLQGSPEAKQLEALKDYCSYRKLVFSTQRNHAMATALRERFMVQDKPLKKGGLQRKRVKPEDLVFLYDRLHQNLTEQAALTDSGVGELQARQEIFAVFRCFYIAESYRKFDQWTEASVLFEKAVDLAKAAIASVASNVPESDLEELKQLCKDSLGLKYLSAASGFLESEKKTSEVVGKMARVTLDKPKELSKRRRELMERLDDFDAGEAEQCHNVVSFPPAFEAAPCKPILFDLAWNAIEYPSLEHRLPKKARTAEQTQSAGWSLGRLFGR